MTSSDSKGEVVQFAARKDETESLSISTTSTEGQYVASYVRTAIRASSDDSKLMIEHRSSLTISETHPLYTLWDALLSALGDLENGDSLGNDPEDKQYTIGPGDWNQWIRVGPDVEVMVKNSDDLGTIHVRRS